MNVLLIGSGGREHALAWALSASPLLTKLFCAPGNAGIADVARMCPHRSEQPRHLIQFCRDERIELVVIGPEAPLVAGLGDALAEAGIRSFGPTKSGRAARRLEGLHQRSLPRPPASRPQPMAVSWTRGGEDVSRAQSSADRREGGRPGRRQRRDHRRRHAKKRRPPSTRACPARSARREPKSSSKNSCDGEEASFFALCDGVNALPLGRRSGS